MPHPVRETQCKVVAAWLVPHAGSEPHSNSGATWLDQDVVLDRNQRINGDCMPLPSGRESHSAWRCLGLDSNTWFLGSGQRSHGEKYFS